MTFNASDFAPSLTSDHPPDAQQSSLVPASVNSSQVNMQPGQTSSSSPDCPASSQQINQSFSLLLTQISEQAVLQEEVPNPVTVSPSETNENNLQQLKQSCVSQDVMPEESLLDEDVSSQAILPEATDDSNPQHRDQVFTHDDRTVFFVTSCKTARKIHIDHYTPGHSAIPSRFKSS